MRKSHVFYAAALAAGLFEIPHARGQMMGGGKYPGMMCPGMQGQAGLMHDPEVKLAVKDIPDGVVIEWTSKDPEKAKALKNMGQRMASMHEDQLKDLRKEATKAAPSK